MFFRAAILILFWFASFILQAQEYIASADNPSAGKEGSVIVTRNGSITISEFPQQKYITISQIEFEGNIETRDHIIRRELLVSEGDTISPENISSLLERSRENLLNTSLFNFVNVDLVFHEFLPQANIKFAFVERWYIWPFPIFEIAERNFNDWILSPSFHRVNYGGYIVKENFRGRKEKLSLLARFGYRQIFSLNYNIPYISQKQNLGLNLSLGYSRRNEIEYLTQNNSQLFYSEPGSWALERLFVQAGLRYRKGIHHHHNLFLEFNNYLFADSLLVLNPQFSPSDETRAPFFGIGYEFRNDHRDFRAYPLRGYYYDIRFKRQGLGLLRNEKMDITQLETSIRKFWELSPRWFFAAGVNAKTMIGDFKPYYLQQGLGFRGDIVRGYEDFVVDGQHFAVLKTNFKYNILPSRVTRIGFINNEKFSLIHYALYVNFFSDLGYVRDNFFFSGNPYSNTWLLGSGIGFDLVTYYDKVFRTEFAITRHGVLGVHLHLIAPI
jgi:outer membrane protein assembly factor BamA